MKLRILLFLGVAGLAAATVSAQTPGTEPQPQTLEGTPQTTTAGTPLRASGTVVSSSSTELVLDTPSGRQTFKVDGSSRLPGGLTVGSQVDVTYHDMNGMLHLGEATVTTAAAPSTPSTTAAPFTSTTAEPSTTTTAAGTGDPVTVTGTIVSSTPTQLVVRTDTGTQTFQVGEDARMPIGLQADDRVTVEYETAGDGTLRAMNVTTLGADAPTQTAELPRTASDLPLLGFIGLLALGGAVALRMVRYTS